MRWGYSLQRMSAPAAICLTQGEINGIILRRIVNGTADAAQDLRIRPQHDVKQIIPLNTVAAGGCLWYK